MDYYALWQELDNDPLGRGYSGMSNAEAAADLNTEYRTQHKATLTSDEMFTKTDATEFSNLTDHKQDLWVGFCGHDIDPWDSVNVSFVKWIFGNQSTTVSNLGGARTDSISRAAELGLGTVKPGHVQNARLVHGG